MKIKNLIALTCLFGVAVFSTGFMKKAVIDASFETPENRTMKKEPIVENESFAEFLSHFEKKELPLSIGLEDFKEYKAIKNGNAESAKSLRKKQTISPIARSEYIRGAINGFGRMGPPEILPVARFYSNEKMVAVIYSSKPNFRSGLDKWYDLVLFDMNGNMISHEKDIKNKDSFQVAYSSVEKSMTCHIDEKGRVWKNTYDNLWKKDLEENWINENEITGFEIENTEVFEIKENGQLERLKEIPTVAKASLN